MSHGAFWVHRELFDHWLWKNKPFSMGQAWIDMIGLANHADVKVPYKDEITTIRRGEFVRSRRALADRWGWNESRVQRFIVLLENDSMIERKSNQKANHVIICNYDKYQTLRTKNEPKMNQQRTNSEPTANINNKNKNVKNVKKEDIYPVEFLRFWGIYPKKKSKDDALRAWRQINPSNGTMDLIVAAIDWQKNTDEWIREEGKYIPYPATYLRRGAWKDEPEQKPNDSRNGNAFLECLDDQGRYIGPKD